MRLTFELELVDISTTVASASCTGLILAVSKVYKLSTLKPGVHAAGKHTFVLFSLPHHAEIWLINWFLKCVWVSECVSEQGRGEWVCVCVSKWTCEGVINRAACRVREGAINQSSEQESEWEWVSLKSYQVLDIGPRFVVSSKRLEKGKIETLNLGLRAQRHGCTCKCYTLSKGGVQGVGGKGERDCRGGMRERGERKKGTRGEEKGEKGRKCMSTL